jgi:hypothetical protein
MWKKKSHLTYFPLTEIKIQLCDFAYSVASLHLCKSNFLLQRLYRRSWKPPFESDFRTPSSRTGIMLVIHGNHISDTNFGADLSFEQAKHIFSTVVYHLRTAMG